MVTPIANARKVTRPAALPPTLIALFDLVAVELVEVPEPDEVAPEGREVGEAVELIVRLDTSVALTVVWPLLSGAGTL